MAEDRVRLDQVDRDEALGTPLHDKDLEGSGFAGETGHVHLDHHLLVGLRVDDGELDRVPVPQLGVVRDGEQGERVAPAMDCQVVVVGRGPPGVVPVEDHDRVRPRAGRQGEVEPPEFRLRTDREVVDVGAGLGPEPALVVGVRKVSGARNVEDPPFRDEVIHVRGDQAVLEGGFRQVRDVVNDHPAARVYQGRDSLVETDLVVAHVVEVEIGFGGDVVDDLEHRGPFVAALSVREDMKVSRQVARIKRLPPGVDPVRDDPYPDSLAGVAKRGPEPFRKEEGVPLRLDRSGVDLRGIDRPDRPDEGLGGEVDEAVGRDPRRHDSVLLVAVRDPSD